MLMLSLYIQYLPNFEAEDVSLVEFCNPKAIFCFVAMVIIVKKVSTITRIVKAAAPLTAMPIFLSISHFGCHMTWPNIDKAMLKDCLLDLNHLFSETNCKTIHFQLY